MSAFLSEQIERFGEVSESDRWRTEPADAERAGDIAELAATAIFLLDRLETAAAREQPARPAWDVAAARRFAPLFRDWYIHASTVLKLIKESHSRGQAVEGASEFIHRFNAVKLLAVDMDHTVASYERSLIPSGKQNGIPLERVNDELCRRAGSTGDR